MKWDPTDMNSSQYHHHVAIIIVVIVVIMSWSIQLKTQHGDRPIWVLPDGHIYLEASSLYYHQVSD